MPKEFIKTSVRAAAQGALGRSVHTAINEGACPKKISKNAARGAASAAAHHILATGAKAALRRTGANALAKTGAPGALAALALDGAGATVDLFKGKISGCRFRARIGRSAIGIGSSTVAAEIGAALGTCVAPGPGTFVGAAIGGLLGGRIADHFMN